MIMLLHGSPKKEKGMTMYGMIFGILFVEIILRAWANYFKIGNSAECFGYIKDWVEKKIRRHLMRARKKHGFGWNR